MSVSLVNFKKSGLADFKDPFTKDCIQEMHFHCYNRTLFGNQSFSARVQFKNGNTGGEQRFQAESFPSLVKKVQTFIEELEK